MWMVKPPGRCAVQLERGNLGHSEVDMARRAQSDFLAAVSHELRTPLFAIIGFSELLQREVVHLDAGDTAKSYVQDIFNSGQNLLETINNLLDLSKAWSGTLELSETAVDVRDAATASCRLIESRLKDAEVTLTVLMPDTLPLLLCDERKLKKALFHLLSNAAKFTPTGGRIEIEATNAPTAFTITVRDSGAGMSKADLVRLTHVLTQVSGEGAYRHPGIGLGLTVLRSIMTLHGGDLRLESNVGHGTAVHLIFPSNRVIAGSDQMAAPVSSPKPSNLSLVA